MFTSTIRALSQLGDPAFTGVLWRSVAWSALVFLSLHFAAIWAVGHFLTLHGLTGFAAGALGAIGASLLTFWLFLPVAAAIGTLYVERIADAVERRFYPWLLPAQGASLVAQGWDGVMVAVQIMAFTLLALLLAIVLPGAGLILGWAITSYAYGRGLFVAVAMRRMNRAEASAVYRAHRGVVLLQGAIMALVGYIPILNLLLPVLGTAAMVHVLDHAMAKMSRWHQGSIGAAS